MGGASVYFPHLYIDLQRRKHLPIPGPVQSSVEEKIRSLQRWTAMEKAQVLGARHEQTIRYVLAYALAQAKLKKYTGGVWIPLGMNTGAQGHANAVCLQAVDGRGSMKVLVYDPNYKAGQDYWVHAKKAVDDALPS